MACEIHIPDLLSDKNLAPFFRGWYWNDDPSGPVELIVKRGTHLAPWAVTLIAAYSIWLREVREKDIILTYEEDSYLGRHLERLGLPQILGYDVKVVSHETQRICPLTRIQTSKEIAPFVTSVMELLDIDDIEVADAVKYSLVELLRNVVQHSRSKIGGVAAAVYFPHSGLVDVVVADVGCGIKSALREAYPEINSDMKAVKFALMPHVSGTFTSGSYHNMKDNAGLGLFFTKEIASRSGGGFFLASGNMMASSWGNSDGSPGKNYFQAKGQGWRGTFALLQLRKDSIGEFNALLAHCRDIAAEARKDRSEFMVDFLDDPLEIEGLITINVKEFEEDVEAAAIVRDEQIIPYLKDGDLVVLDFSGIRAATQSFIHALMYKTFREGEQLLSGLTIACADNATEEAIRAVAAYAAVEGSN